MKRKRFSWSRCSLLVALAGFFLYSASVQEVHYLFVHHETAINHHCHNHLHQQDNHKDCALCNIDLGFFVQTYSQFDVSVQIFAADCKIYNLSDAVISNQFAAPSLRGPPSLA